MTAIRVMIVDDHEMVAESLRRALDAADDIEVAAVAATVAEAIAGAGEHRPDVILMDFGLPDGTGAEATAAIRALELDAKVLLLTGGADPRALSAALDAGCVGYLEKTVALDRLVDAVRAVAAGETVLDTGELERVFSERRAFDSRARLTEREEEVLGLVAEGLSNQAIADRLTLSVNTVRTHVQTVLTKLGAHSKLEASVIARSQGLLPPD